jgi:hypothetical protein
MRRGKGEAGPKKAEKQAYAGFTGRAGFAGARGAVPLR